MTSLTILNNKKRLPRHNEGRALAIGTDRLVNVVPVTPVPPDLMT